MSRPYVVAAALGPVASFIAAGRRSRDLWYGSRFLSEITRVAAKALVDGGVELLVPLTDQLERSFLHEQSYRGPTISNKILGIVAAGGEAPATILRAAETKVRTFVRDELQRLCRDPRLRAVIVRTFVDQQAKAIEGGDFVEVYGAWAPIDDAADGESRAIARAMELLAARKHTRTFTAPPAIRSGVPKSSLDPGRESVLIELDPREVDRTVARQLEARRVRAGIRSEERLDAISLARRRAVFDGTDADLGPLPFPSLARVALEPWLEGARTACPEVQKALGDVVAVLRGLDTRDGSAALFFVSSPVRDPGARAPGGHSAETARFGYDPEVLLENAITALERGLQLRRATTPQPSGVEELADEQPDTRLEQSVERAQEALAKLRGPVAVLHHQHGVPLPYYALVEADGDGIGRLLAEAPTREIRAALVQALYDFSWAAWEVIEGHHGCAFYVGGDELAAYLPADRAMAAVGCLAAEFATRVGEVAARLVPAAVATLGPATLSAGVVLAHVHDDLRQTRREAHEALGDAKQARRRQLAIALAAGRACAPAEWGWASVREQPRAGTTRACVGRISELVRDHARYCDLLGSDEVSLSLAHDLLADAQAMETAPGGALGLDLARSKLQQKLRRSGRDGERPELAPLHARLGALASWREVRNVAAELLLAERVARVKRQEEGTPR